MAIEAKQAVVAAMKSVTDLFSDVGTQDLLLEEVDSSKDGKNWLITVSFVRTVDAIPGYISLLGNDYKKRQYKVVKIDKETGAFAGAKMRAKVTLDDVE